MKPINLMFFLLILTFFSCKKNGSDKKADILQLSFVKVGTNYLDSNKLTENIPVDKNILISFNSILDTSSVKNNILLKKEETDPVKANIQFNDQNQTIVLSPSQFLINSTNYSLEILSGLKGENQEIFPGMNYLFKTENETFKIEQITINNLDFSTSQKHQNINFKNITIAVEFSEALNASDYESYFSFSGNAKFKFSLFDNNKKLSIQNTEGLDDFKQYFFSISSNLTAKNGFKFEGYNNSFYTSLDSTFDFPEISNNNLLNLIQEQTFKYFWDFAHPVSGLARERNTSGDIVTSGGSGFGIMSLIVGIERNFISREQGLDRMEKIVNFLENAERFHGAWSHWLDGKTGAAIPFSQKDDGGDLVETSFLVQGLLTFRQYLNPNDNRENALINKINTLWQGVEWTWYTQGGQNVLYWHWSPNYGWQMNFALHGYYEAMITYILATASPTYGIASNLYHEGWCKNGEIQNGKEFYGYTLPLGYDYGGPLFFAHYSFLGLDPRNLQDAYANYWEQNVNHSLINWTYCKTNPKQYVGYSEDCWGLTASDNESGYSAHSPTNDLGVITPTAALSSMPFTPEQSTKAMRHFYYLLGNKLWGEYGFYDAFNPTAGWWASSYLAIDQGPIVIMIENYRSALLWDLFMSCPEVTLALDDLGFSY